MSEQSKIQWTDSTGGPWLVCSEVSPGCAHCYARELIETRLAPLIRKAYRNAGFEDWETRSLWGDTAPRVLSKGFWTDIKRFNAQPWICDACGMPHALPGQICMRENCECESKHRRRIFPSLIDWLDDMPAGIIDQDGNTLERDQIFARFLNIVRLNDQVTWILCTKRPESFYSRLRCAAECICDESLDDLVVWIGEWALGTPPKNVVVLTTVENQAMESRLDALRKIPAVCHGVSFEPLLSEINVRDWTGISWGIIGGESGNDARPCKVEWIHSLVGRGNAAGVDMLVKQLGSLAICDNANLFDWPEDVQLKPHGEGFAASRVMNLFDWPEDVQLKPHGEGFAASRVMTRDKKGGDIAEFPAQLCVRNFPKGF